jgi:hypothetical protein
MVIIEVYSEVRITVDIVSTGCGSSDGTDLLHRANVVISGASRHICRAGDFTIVELRLN